MQVIINIENKDLRIFIENSLRDFSCYACSYLDVIAVKYSGSVVISDSLENVRELASKNIKCLAVSKSPNFMQAQKFLNAGAKGYANARMQPAHFVDAINCINNGSIWILPEIIENMISLLNQSQKADASEMLEILNEREKIVANYIKDGLSNQQIAELLQLSERTIKSISSSIYLKLGVKNRIQFVMSLKNLS